MRPADDLVVLHQKHHKAHGELQYLKMIALMEILRILLLKMSQSLVGEWMLMKPLKTGQSYFLLVNNEMWQRKYKSAKRPILKKSNLSIILSTKFSMRVTYVD